MSSNYSRCAGLSAVAAVDLDHHTAGNIAMPIVLDHLIVPSRNRVESAKSLAGILGVPWAENAAIGPFSPVFVSDELTLDFDESGDAFHPGHFCFRVSETEFDAVLARLVQRTIPYRSLPLGPVDHQVNVSLKGRIVYWSEPNEHVWEMLTVSYARKTGPVR